MFIFFFKSQKIFLENFSWGGEKCPNSKFFWSIFFCILTKITPFLDNFYAVLFVKEMCCMYSTSVKNYIQLHQWCHVFLEQVHTKIYLKSRRFEYKAGIHLFRTGKLFFKNSNGFFNFSLKTCKLCFFKDLQNFR